MVFDGLKTPSSERTPMKEFLGAIAVGLLIQLIYAMEQLPREIRWGTWRTIVPLSLCVIIAVVVVYLGWPQSGQSTDFVATWNRLCQSAAQNFPEVLRKL
jgi:hypothetical protein